MDLLSLAHECWQTSEDHGWHDKERTVGDVCALIHSEVSEALEHYRDGRPLTEIFYSEEKPDKPDGFPIELADVIIRTLDAAEVYNVDIVHALELKLEFNKTRPFRHGGKVL